MSDWGRWEPHRITPDLARTLAEQIKRGMTPKLAAKSAGIPPGIFRRWLEDGQREVDAIYEDERGYPSQTGMLWLWVAKAEADRAEALLGGVLSAGKQDEWRNLTWMLERLERGEFGERVEVAHTGPDGGPVEIEGRAVVGLADVIALAERLGAGDQLRVDAGDSQPALPRAGEVLPDPPQPEPTAEPPPDVEGQGSPVRRSSRRRKGVEPGHGGSNADRMDDDGSPAPR